MNGLKGTPDRHRASSYTKRVSFQSPPNFKLDDNVRNDSIESRAVEKALLAEKRDLELQIEDYKQQGTQALYINSGNPHIGDLADIMENTLDSMGVNYGDNSTDGLVQLALLLGLHDVSSSAYTAALTDTYLELDTLQVR
jgi:hypothetical protein